LTLGIIRRHHPQERALSGKLFLVLFDEVLERCFDGKSKILSEDDRKYIISYILRNNLLSMRERIMKIIKNNKLKELEYLTSFYEDYGSYLFKDSGLSKSRSSIENQLQMIKAVVPTERSRRS
jgi:hypothetical protein